MCCLVIRSIDRPTLFPEFTSCGTCMHMSLYDVALACTRSYISKDIELQGRDYISKDIERKELQDMDYIVKNFQFIHQ